MSTSDKENSRDNATQSSEESGRVYSAQEETWRRTLRDSGDEMKILQFEENYPPKEGHDHYHPQWIPTDLYEWHPKPSNLQLTLTHSGKWVKVPRYRETPGPDYLTYKVGRVEK